MIYIREQKFFTRVRESVLPLLALLVVSSTT